MITSLKRRHLLGAAAALPLATPAIAQRAKVLRYGHPVPAESVYNKALLRFADYVAKESGGKLKVEAYPSNSLGPIKDQLTNVQLGAQAMASAVPAWYSNFVKPMDVFTLPYIVGSAEKLRAAIDGPFGAKMKGMMEQAGFKVVGTWLIGGRHIVNARHEVHSPADMPGLKIRVISSQVYIEAFRALGASPVALDPSEIYLGIQQRVVDGMEYPLPDIIDQKMYEVAKFITLDNHVTDVFFCTISRTMWDAMSKEEQGIITEGMRTSCDWQWSAQPKSIDDSLAKLRTMLTVTDLTPEQKKQFVDTTRPVYAKFEGSIGKETIDEAIKALS